MSRGYGKCELAILTVLEAWSPFPLMKLLPGKYTRAQAEALKRAARGLAKKGEIGLDYDDQGKLLILKQEVQYGELVDGVIELHPSSSPPELKPGQRLVIKFGDGKYKVIVGRKLNREPLSSAEADRLAGRSSRGRAPEWGKREAELDRLYNWGRARDSTRGWRQGESESNWDKALLEKAARIVADRKDHLETQERLEREWALRGAIEDDRRRGRKWRKGLRPCGDEDSLDDEGPDTLPDEGGRRAVDAVDAVAAVAGQESAIRLIAEPAGTITQMGQEQTEQELAEQEQTEQERQQAITQDEWSDEEALRNSSMKPSAYDDEVGEAGGATDDDLGDDGDAGHRRGRQPPP